MSMTLVHRDNINRSIQMASFFCYNALKSESNLIIIIIII